jgi:hypothetical protein
MCESYYIEGAGVTAWCPNEDDEKSGTVGSQPLTPFKPHVDPGLRGIATSASGTDDAR